MNLNNAVRVLEADPKLRGIVWFDEFLQRMLTGSPAREWTDADDINLTLYIQREIGISKMGHDTVSRAVVSMAMRDVRNCVLDWMQSLKWDGVSRIDEFMIRAFKAKDDIYTRAISRNFWLTLAARTYEPGCKADNMVVLEGSQGAMKSTAVAMIAGDWFGEQHESATNAKAFAEILQGKLIIEISEMDSFDRAEVKAVKGVVSCQSDRFRAAYARYAKDNPRRGIMVGTTNKDDWNRDETGARRFWPIACNGFADLEYIARHREQLFAEAVAIYKLPGVGADTKTRLAAGAAWWTVPEAETLVEQRKRYDADPWMGPISAWVVGMRETTINEVAGGCLNLELREIDRAKQMRVGSVLRALGWTNDGNKRREGRVVKVWTPPEGGQRSLHLEPEVATHFGEVATPVEKSSSANRQQDDSLFDRRSDLEDGSGGETEVATLRSLHDDDIPFQ